MMKQGSILFECDNEFYFQSIKEEIPCMACGKYHINNGEPVPEEGEEDGTDISRSCYNR